MKSQHAFCSDLGWTHVRNLLNYDTANFSSDLCIIESLILTLYADLEPGIAEDDRQAYDLVDGNRVNINSSASPPACSSPQTLARDWYKQLSSRCGSKRLTSSKSYINKLQYKQLSMVSMQNMGSFSISAR